MDPISGDDHTSISHINFVTNKSHDLVDELYEDLMDRNNDKAKQTAQQVCKVMADLIQSLTDEI
jgi:type I restriction-modification system DNA methylase subunit